ncbi:phospholipid transport system substrate-binding protein [Natronospira proteinivora]|uniref:Phospholipid transport system substrate-binding protein n=1 Tax=Natronospira proteinivora TaxID=1807133 RepID=A0ABT1G6A5_9GAMM|nr:ABC transporter substrate-binding protein [Natronospira proteinivora]MCP1726475.1 phospholipid transport system substrate-binding protein [Natronospira proteinivora]
MRTWNKFTLMSAVVSIFSALTLLAWTPPAKAESLPDPAEMVERTANEILNELKERREEMQEDPREAYEFVEEILLPVFDVPYATRLVMGRHGRDASREQRRAFGEAFYSFLVRSYADGLIEYDISDVDIEVRPVRGEPDPDRTRVRTVIKRSDGGDIPVDYSLRYTDDGWKVFDVTIEGVSYVTNYRNSFDSEIRQRGLDTVIERLEERARKAGEELEESMEEGAEDQSDEDSDE